MKAAALALAAVAALAAWTPVRAQTTPPPGPWVIDIRGVTSPVPDDAVFYPPLDRTAIIPSRGFGLDVGVHVYILDVGPSRLGIGANALNVRATTQPAAPASSGSTTDTATPRAVGQSLQVDIRSVAPQVSFNFGSRDGWSYVSAGAGLTDVITKTAGVGAARREAGRIRALNFGGGARWFLRSHFAFGFDIRLYRLGSGTAGAVEQSTPEVPSTTPPSTGTTPPSAASEPASTPGKMILVVGVGLSFK
jgi:hypothetical protein